jgi:hypothetical protein
MITVSIGISLVANAPSPPFGDGRTVKYSLEKCVENDKSEDEEKVEEKEEAGE